MTNNYFVVPKTRRPRAILSENGGDALVGRRVKAGDLTYRLLSRFDVQYRVKGWTNGQRAVVPVPPTTCYFRARLETAAGESGAEVVLRVEKDKAGPDAVLTCKVIDRSDEEWITVKVAKILETPSKPDDVDWARYFFFDDRDPASTLKAYEAAKLVSSKMAIFKPAPIPGPWSSAGVVGVTSIETN